MRDKCKRNKSAHFSYVSLGLTARKGEKGDDNEIKYIIPGYSKDAS